MNDQFLFSSSVVDLSEEQDYLTLKNKICFFDSENLNRVQIDYDPTTLSKCQTLINMPVCAAYVKRNGKDDLGGHEVKVVNGKVKFGTATIGVVTNVEINQEDVETVNGEVKNLPVLYADERIWTRNENATNAIKRLYLDGKLFSSWEVKSSEYFFKDGIKHLTGYQFLANCLLGSKSYPAYGTGGARVLEISEQSDQYEYLAAESILSEALALDIESASASNINLNQLDDANRKEDLSMDVNESIVVETSEEETKEETVETVNVEETAEVTENEVVDNEVAEVSNDDPVEESTTEVDSAESEDAEGDVQEEVSTMKTMRDIRRMIYEALHDSNKDEFDVSFVFPEEKVILVQNWNMKELEYIQYSYRVDGDKVVLEDEKKVELTISPLQINSELEKKNNTIADANNRIVELEKENAELSKAKKELDEIKANQAESEHAEAVNKLREYVVKSGRFTEEEIVSEKIQNAINELNESWLKSEIADRLVASLIEDKTNKVETSETNESKDFSIVLSENENQKTATTEDILNAFFDRKG